MYETFYHLSANPFRLVPDPRFCFEHAGHSEARAYLSYALKLGEGFIVITGRPGTGKTTLVQVFLKELELSRMIAKSIAASNFKAIELLRAVAYAFDIDAAATDKATLRRRIRQFFSRQVQSGKRVLLIIDEAQGLPQAALEELRLLADLQTGSRPLLQLFLVGQEKLRDLMRAPAMEQFQQRVIGTFRLEPLTVEQTRDYIEHRLRQANWKGDPEITGAALLGIQRYSRGVPRHINKVCTRLFLHGVMKGSHVLDAEDVLAIATELHDEQLAPLGTDRSDLSQAVGADPSAHAAESARSLDELAVCYEEPGSADRESQAVAGASVANRRQMTERPGSAALRPGAVASPPGPVTGPRRRQQRPESSAVVVAARQIGAEALLVARVLAAEGMVAARALGARGLRTVTRIDRAEKRFAYMVVISLAALVGFSAFVGDDEGDEGYLFVQHPGPSSTVQPPNPHAPAPDRRRDVGTATGQALQGWGAAGSGRAFRDGGFQDEHDTPASRGGAGRTAASSDTAQQVQSAGGAGSPPRAVKRSTDLASSSEHGASASKNQGRAVVEAASAMTGSLQHRAQPEHRPTEVVNGPEGGDTPVLVATVASSTGRPEANVEHVGTVHPETDPTAPNRSAAPRAGQEDGQVAELLARAQRSLARDRLLVPSWDDAYGYYQEVLELQPGNLAAILGMGKIADRYVVLVKRALARRDDEKARLYIARGLRVQPGDPRLALLRERVDEMHSSARVEPPTGPAAPASVPASREAPSDFLSRLKAFFTGNRSGEEARPPVR
jgi:type II secretory pathway predicted ATPase ExeA